MGFGSQSVPYISKDIAMTFNILSILKRNHRMIPFTVISISSLKYALPLGVLGATSTAFALDSNQVLIALIASISGLISSYVGFKQWRGQNDIEKARVDVNRTQARSEVQEVAIDRNNRLVDQLQEQLNAEVQRGIRYVSEVSELRREVRTLTNALVVYEVGTYKLIGQIKDLNQEPVWVPDRPKDKGDPNGIN